MKKSISFLKLQERYMKKENKNHKSTKKSQNSSLYFYESNYTYVFCSLTDRQTDQILAHKSDESPQKGNKLLSLLAAEKFTYNFDTFMPFVACQTGWRTKYSYNRWTLEGIKKN